MFQTENYVPGEQVSQVGAFFHCFWVCSYIMNYRFQMWTGDGKKTLQPPHFCFLGLLGDSMGTEGSQFFIYSLSLGEAWSEGRTIKLTDLFRSQNVDTSNFVKWLNAYLTVWSLWLSSENKEITWWGPSFKVKSGISTLSFGGVVWFFLINNNITCVQLLSTHIF